MKLFEKAFKMWIVAHQNDCWELSDSEKNVFTKLVNLYLKDDQDCAHKVPIALNDDIALTAAFEDGILMCKLLLIINPDCLDERAIIMEADEDKMENVTMGIQAASSNNINMTGIGSRDFTERNQVMVLCFLWQALRLLVFRKINLHDTPEIKKLGKEKENYKTLNKIRSEEILSRWVQYHQGEIENLKESLADPSILLNVIAHTNDSAVEESDDKFAQLVQ